MSRFDRNQPRDRQMGDLFSQQRRTMQGQRMNNNNRRNNNRSQPDYNSMPLEQGLICSLKDSFGFIYCADRPLEVFFHYSQVLVGSTAASSNDTHPANDLQMDAEVEFRIGENNGKMTAFQVRAIEPGTVQWETVEQESCYGLVESTPGALTGRRGVGTIRVTNNEGEAAEGEVQTVDFRSNDIEDTGKASRLTKGDLVHFSMVTDRRTNELCARSISLVMTFRERKRQEQEKKLLADATLEEGVITALKGEYGFLRSNKRREEVYFHYSSIDLDEVDDKEAAESEAEKDGDLVLKEGQDMKFLVVTEQGEDGKPQRRVSARRVSLQPRGSVKFHDVLARGVVGYVSLIPQPQDSGHELELQGKVKLTHSFNDEYDGEERVISEVFLHSKDSPGGSYPYKNGSSVGVWVELGDKLLFDVVRDYSDGACRAVPTKCLKPRSTKEDCLRLEEDETDSPSRIRLMSLSVSMRAEGIIHTVKDTFGFIHFADRPADAHFKLFQILPDELQDDLRRFMGVANVDRQGKQLRLASNTQVQFDLAIHGNIPSHATSGRQKVKERENLKAQRILFLPPDTVFHKRNLGSNMRCTITSGSRQPYCGTVEVTPEGEMMSLADRHPLVAKLVDEFLQNDLVSTIDFQDTQSAMEDATLAKMIMLRGQGRLKMSHVGRTDTYLGRVRIEKLPVNDSTVDATVPTGAKDSEDGKAKPITARFDKSSLSKELRNDKPPGKGDVVQLNLVHLRRTGQLAVENMSMLERAKAAETPDENGVGVVKEVVAKSKLGFISVIDETAENMELLVFQLSNVDENNLTQTTLQAGDEVKFRIGKDKKGKRVAIDVTRLAPGSLESKSEASSCKGFILLQPTKTSLKNTPSRQRSNLSPVRTGEKKSRWDRVDADLKKQPETAAPTTELGCILLTEDPTGMFVSKDDSPTGASYLHYKNGALAVHGAGSASASDESSRPRRGDLVSFVKTKKGNDSVRDIRIVDRGSGTLIRGKVTEMDDSTVTVQSAMEGEEMFTIPKSRVVGCDPTVLKVDDKVDGLVHDGVLHGVCRSSDLKLESKLGTNLKERPKLNLTVKRDRGGTIMAQSMMAKGPSEAANDYGFAAGWTSRMSAYVTPYVPEEDANE